MKLGYLHMIQKPSDNQCSGSQHQLQDQKKARMSHSKFKALLILDEIALKCEKEITGIMEKRVDFAPGQRASPQRIVCEAIFS